MGQTQCLAGEEVLSVFIYFFTKKEDGATWLPERLVRQGDTDLEYSSKYDSNLLDG